MNKSFYLFARFFLGLSVAVGLLQSLIRFTLGAGIFFLESSPDWYLVANTVSLLGVLFLLKYYHYQEYWFSFISGALATLAVLCECIVIYMLLVARELERYYIPVTLFVLGTGMLYGVSLIVSKSGERPWLRRGGILLSLISLISLLAFIWGMPFQDAKINSTLEKISQWISLTASLVPLLYILHFWGESRRLKEDYKQTSSQKYWENAWVIVGLLSFGFTFVLGVMITNESYSSIYWGKRNFEKTQQLAKLFEARIYVSSKGDTLRYRLLKPQDYNPQKKYPLVVCLPYGGQPGTDIIRQLEGAAAAQILSEGENRKKYPAFTFVPNCPPGSGWGGVPNYPAVDSLVYATLTALEKEPGIDVNRRYVTGISRGGYGAWHFISTHPEMFAAAIPVCGAGDPRFAPQMAEVAVWAFHGEKDRNVPVSGSRNVIEAIKKAGGNPRYTEFAGAGHNIWYQVTQTPGVWDWLFAQKRDQQILKYR